MQNRVPCRCPLALVCSRDSGPFREIRRRDQHVLFLQGTPANRVFFVQRGSVSLHRMSSEDLALGRAHSIRHAGDFLGVEAIVGDSYQDSARAETDLELCVAERDDFLAWLGPRETPAFRVLEGLLRQDDDDRLAVEDLEGSARQRVASYLLHHAHDAEQRVLRSVVADVLHMRPETLSRTLHELAEQGLIQLSRRGIVVLDPGRLRSRASKS